MQINNHYNSNTYYKISPKYIRPVSFGQASRHRRFPDRKISICTSLYEKLKNKFRSRRNIEPSENISSNKIFEYINNLGNTTRKGTILEGAKPLSEFWKNIRQSERIQILNRGISTNDIGDSYSLLKSDINNPISTSFVEDCSVIYLYNKHKQTHFLYHLYPDMPPNEFLEVVEKFVPEGYTKACIIPGDSYFKDFHEQYLPNIIGAIKKTEPNANVQIYYSQTAMPEIVGYKGNVFEIENANFDGYDCGQASFKISNILSYEVFNKIKKCKTKEDIDILRIEFKNRNYDESINTIINNLLEEQAKNLL